MDKDIIRFQFRLPVDLHEQLKLKASQAARSLNSEMVYRLSQSLNNHTTKVAQPLSENRNLPVYFDPPSLLELIAHLKRTEITFASKSEDEISSLLKTRILEIFTSEYSGGLECLHKGAYAQGFVARGRGEHVDQPVLYIQFLTICEHNGRPSYEELRKD